jgi:hypothetical protein
MRPAIQLKRHSLSSALQALHDFSVALAADTALPAHTSGIDLPPSLAISPALSVALTFLEVVMMPLCVPIVHAAAPALHGSVG